MLAYYLANLYKYYIKNKRHSLDSWRKVIDINLSAPFIISSYVVEQMVINRTKGLIINISSISAKGNAGQRL